MVHRWQDSGLNQLVSVQLRRWCSGDDECQAGVVGGGWPTENTETVGTGAE